ncbi:caprin-2 [Hyperolius riggenbachi]|uniref:caprin-2 n=1 Tax=Hyperolius riggenbachi TaxID=752182 RepID=UPI0035A32811
MTLVPSGRQANYQHEFRARLALTMVQLSPVSPRSPGGDSPLDGDIKLQSERGLGSLQSPLSSSATPLQVYETYIENGLISLKHKIRNIEKKKVKLEDYRDRLNNGEELNSDQLESVQKYDEVLHNLEFAKELQKTFSALSQDLIKAQKKAIRREQVQRAEAEKKRLRTVLQVQYVLQALCQDHVLKDCKDGLDETMHISSKELDSLSKFARLLCHKRFKHMSLEDEMDQTSVYWWNLLEGNEKTVAGTNYKCLKELVARMLDCGYFESVPDPPIEKKLEILAEEPPKKPPMPELDKVTKTEVVKEPGEREEFENWIDDLNQNDINLHLTSNWGGNRLEFLDLQIEVADKQVITKTFRKDTASDMVLHGESFHPKKLKNSLPYSQMVRMKRNNSDTLEGVKQITESRDQVSNRFSVQKKGVLWLEAGELE